MVPRFLFQLFSRFYPTDILARKYPVSVKGVVLIDGKVVLLKNVRDEWELPGGKLDKGESPIECVIREIDEELNLVVKKPQMIDSWIYRVGGKVDVLILTYYCCHTYHNPQELRISHEHKEAKLFDEKEITGLNMPEGYKKSIHAVFKSLKEEEL